MKKTILTVVLVIAAVFLLFGCTSVTNDAMQKEDTVMEKEDSNSMMKDDSMMENDDSMMKDNNSEMMEDNSMMHDEMTISGYQEFSKSAYEEAKSEGKIIFLEFYANWCPYCAEQKPINESTFKSSDLPENVVGFQVNYKDNATDADEEALAKEFGIAYQHTRVILNSDGTLASKTTGNQSSEEIIAKLNEAY